MNGTKPTVLIVDDSPTQVSYLANFLSKFPLDVLTAASGVQCLRQVDEHHVDVVILDVEMPHMDGLQITHRLRRDPKTSELPIILLSASGDPDSIQRGYKNGANAYINKGPFAEQYLTSTLQRMHLID